MNVLVDTSVLSLALRRVRSARLTDQQRRFVAAFLDLTDRGDALLLGVVRQELLSGVRHPEQFERLQSILDGYDYLDVNIGDHDFAAECSNRCRSAGIAAGDIDMLICAVAIRGDLPVFTTDSDFDRYATRLPVRVYRVAP